MHEDQVVGMVKVCIKERTKDSMVSKSARQNSSGHVLQTRQHMTSSLHIMLCTHLPESYCHSSESLRSSAFSISRMVGMTPASHSISAPDTCPFFNVLHDGPRAIDQDS